MSADSSARATYWLVFAAIIVFVIGIAAWQRMNDTDRRKLLGIT